MKRMSPPTQLEEFAVTRFHLDWLPASESDVDVQSVTESFDYEVFVHAKEKNKFKVEFQLRFRENGVQQRDVGYIVEASMIGIFVVAPEIGAKDRKRVVRLNAVNILYGTFRGVLAGLTGVFPGGKLLLPTISPVHVVAEVEKVKLAKQAALKASRAGQKQLPAPAR